MGERGGENDGWGERMVGEVWGVRVVVRERDFSRHTASGGGTPACVRLLQCCYSHGQGHWVIMRARLIGIGRFLTCFSELLILSQPNSGCLYMIIKSQRLVKRFSCRVQGHSERSQFE